MGKYTDLKADIYSIFASAAWVLENIKTFPGNYVNSTATEFVRVAVIASGLSNVNPPRSASGQLIIDIFVPAGVGEGRLDAIADKLDKYLAGKSIETTLGGNTQLGSSSLNIVGNDGVNPGLYRGSYSISFNYFGK